MDIKNILIDKISPSPINPRKSFDGAACPDEKSGDVININDAYKMKSMIPFLTNKLTTMASNESSNRQSKPIWTNGRKKIHCSPPNMRMRRKALMNAVVISWVKPGSVVTP